MLVENKIIYNDDKSIGYYDDFFDSSNLYRSIYFPETEKLYLTFHKGGVYSYLNINHKLYSEFRSSESQGKFFSTKIKNNDSYPFRKEYDSFPSEMDEIKEIIEINKKKKRNCNFCKNEYGIQELKEMYDFKICEKCRDGKFITLIKFKHGAWNIGNKFTYNLYDHMKFIDNLKKSNLNIDYKLLKITEFDV